MRQQPLFCKQAAGAALLFGLSSDKRRPRCFFSLIAAAAQLFKLRAPRSTSVLVSEVESRTQRSRPRPRTQKIRGQGQGQGQPFRGQNYSRPRAGMLEAKAKDQGHSRKCFLKKKVFKKVFQAISNLQA